MHPLRKALRRVLMVVLCVSLFFFSMIVTLRVSYHGDKPIDGPLREAIFHADIFQMRALAAFSNDEEDMRIANELLRASIFSPLYAQAGLAMLKSKAEAGYAPAQERLEQIYPSKGR